MPSGRYIAPNLQKASTVNVFAKRRWHDAWTYLPYIYPESFTTTAPPSIGTCSLKSNYGLIQRGDIGIIDYYLPYLINGAYVKIEDNDTLELLGLYQIEEEDVSQNRSYYPSGEQVFTGFELYQILNRIYINGAATSSGIVDETFVFNESLHSATSSGNRSTATLDGIYTFEHRKSYRTFWNNLNIIEYLLEHFVHRYGAASINFNLRGDTDLLENTVDTYNLQGKTVFEALNQLIDRRRGLGWKIEYNFASLMPEIYVFSTINPSVLSTLGLSQSTTVRNFNIALESQGILNNSIRFDTKNNFDRIEITAGNIYSTFTASYANELLYENWTEEEYDRYLYFEGVDTSSADFLVKEAEAVRKEESLDNVFLGHKIKPNWDGLIHGNMFPGDESSFIDYTPDYVNLFPRFNERTGVLDFEYVEDPYIANLKFEPKLSLKDEKDEYRKPFVGAFIEVYDLFDSSSASSYTYYDISDLDARNLPPSGVELGEDSLSIKIKTSQNYLFAKNSMRIDSSSGDSSSYDPDLDVDLIEKPEFIEQGPDYQDIFTTQTIRTNNKLKLAIEAPTYQDVKRVKKIDLSDSINCHYVAPYTIYEIKEGNVLYNSEPYYIKNDIDKLRYLIIIARAFYSVQKAIINFSVVHTLGFLRIGDMILNHVGRMGINPVNTNVTSISRRFTEKGIETTVATGYDELEFTLFDYEKNSGSSGGVTLVSRNNSPYPTSAITAKHKKGSGPTGTVDGISIYDDFPPIPTKTTIIFLSSRNASLAEGAGQKWSASPEFTKWVPIEKFSTLTGVPGSLSEEE